MNKPPMHNYPGQQPQQQPPAQQQQQQQQQSQQQGIQPNQQQSGASYGMPQHHQGNHYAPLNVPGAHNYGAQPAQGQQQAQTGGAGVYSSAKTNAMLQQPAYPMQPGVMYAPASSVATLTDRAAAQQQARNQQQQTPPVSQSLPATQQPSVGRVGGGAVSIMGANQGQAQRPLQPDKPQSNGTTDSKAQPAVTNVGQQQLTPPVRHNVTPPTSSNSTVEKVTAEQSSVQNNSVAAVATKETKTASDALIADTTKPTTKNATADTTAPSTTDPSSGTSNSTTSNANTNPTPPPTPIHKPITTSPTKSITITTTTTSTCPTAAAVSAASAAVANTAKDSSIATPVDSGVPIAKTNSAAEEKTKFKTPEKKAALEVNVAEAAAVRPVDCSDAGKTAGGKVAKELAEISKCAYTPSPSQTVVPTPVPQTATQPTKLASTMKLATTPRPPTRKPPTTTTVATTSNNKSAATISPTNTETSAAVVNSDDAPVAVVGGDVLTSSKRQRTRTTPYQSPIPELEIITKLTRRGGVRGVGATSDGQGGVRGAVGDGAKEGRKDGGKAAGSGVGKVDGERLIIFYRNEFLAVRNSEGGFYICQAGQNIYKKSAKITIRWLSQDKDEKSGEIYTPDFYDYTDFDCILTNLNLERMDRGKYRLPPSERERTDNILTRAIAVEKGDATPMDDSLTEEHPDGLDVSLYRDEEQLMKRNPKRKRSPQQKRGKMTRSASRSMAATVAATAVVKKAAKVRKVIAKVASKSKAAAKRAVAAAVAVAVPSTSSSNKKVKESDAKVAKANAGRTERAKRRQQASPVSVTKSSPVMDQKKARVLAKVVKRTAINAAASKSSKNNAKAPVDKPSKAPKKAINSSRSAATATVSVAIPSTSTGVTRNSKRARK